MKNQISIFMLFVMIVYFTGCSVTEPQREISKAGLDSSTSSTTAMTDSDQGSTVEQANDVIVMAQRSEESLDYNQESKMLSQSSLNTRHELEEYAVMHKKMDDYYRIVPQSAPPMMYDQLLYSIKPASEPLDTENYANFDDNPVKQVLASPVSTFSIDVDTGSYSVVRRIINSGQLPRHDAVRAEELINYFSYDYPERAEGTTPFTVHKEISVTPWNPNTHLLHIGIKGYEESAANLPPANLVFLVDVSGSMQDANKLELLKTSLQLLTRQLRKQDSVSLVVYAGASGVVLEPTTGNQKAKIITALDRLTAGGSTNGAAGIELAYAMAEQAFIPEGINRVILATDGDFNVGAVNIEQLKDLIKRKRNTGIALTTMGFGAGNYNDALMEQLADIGNGNYAYIDSLNEARKVLVDEMSSTMLTIAKDVKIQIEFNLAVVAEYRLIGYENRVLNREDFNNDKVDAGEIGAGHTVTAIYEIALVGSSGQKMDPLRYQDKLPESDITNELAFLRLRYKVPGADTSKLLEWPLVRTDIASSLEETSTEFRFAAAVAAFSQLLRGGEQLGDFSFGNIMDLARDSRGKDPFGYRGEFLSLVRLAESLSTPNNAGVQQLGLIE